MSGCQQNVFYSIFSQIRTVFVLIQGSCTMNVRIEHVHVMVCVIKRETPPVWRWKLCEFQHGENISESGINNSQGGPEPLEKEIHEFLCLKRED